MKRKVGEKGQVTIPKALRERLGIRPGDVLDFDDEEGRLIAVKDVAADPFESARGVLRQPGVGRRIFTSTDEYMSWVRPHRFGSAEQRVGWLEESLREEPPEEGTDT